MIRAKSVLFFFLLSSTCFGQSLGLDEMYDTITSANRAYLDEDKNLNYLKPLMLLRENLKAIERVDRRSKQDYIDFLKMAESYVHIKDSTNLGKQKLSKASTLLDVLPFLTKEIGSTRLVMLNEAHDTPGHRLFAESLLETLYDKGFRYLAIESLYWTDTEINQRGYPISTTGYYTKEPYFSNFIRSAIKQGFVVIPYEQKEGSRDINQREINQANNLIEVLNENPNSKIFVYAGYAHIQEKSKVEGIKWMAERIKDSLKLEVFTINQSSFSENKASQTGRPLLLDIEAQAVQDSLLIPFVGVFDVAIVNSEESENQHLFLGRKKYSLSLTKNFFSNKTPLLLQAYLVEEYANFQDKAIPFDQKLLIEEEQEQYLYLQPKEKYLLILRDIENKIVAKKKIRAKNNLRL